MNAALGPVREVKLQHYIPNEFVQHARQVQPAHAPRLALARVADSNRLLRAGWSSLKNAGLLK
jgi:hypothetical protein